MDSSVLKLCKQLQSLAKVFRFVEVCILLTFLSWLSTHLPFAVKISGEYFRKLISLIFSPISIFLLGNAIVMTLLTKSGLFSGESPPSIDNAVAELYEELRSENREEIPVSLKEENDDVVFQDKEIICEENTTKSSSKVRIEEKNNEEVSIFPEEVKAKSYCRSKSEDFRRESGNDDAEEEKITEKLRRSETEVFWRRFSGEGEAEVTAEDDGMSNDEFRRTIEAFIAKQVRFHREERLSVVLHGQA